jgi:transcriptional regulator with XRE-family HTH domain
MVVVTVIETSIKDAKRTQLSAYLKACRARITPEAVGLPPGPRRRTPGLRREELAQLAGVGITWYTWLEQGRPINASEQVIGAIASALKLDGAERSHLYRLAEVSPTAAPARSSALPEDIQLVLDSITEIPASVISAKFDVLASNAAYKALFPGVVRTDQRHNTLWCAFTIPPCCNPFVYREEEMHRLVAMLRANYGRHVGEPEWEQFISELRAVSPEFTTLWEQQHVAAPVSMEKIFRHAAVGELRMRTTSFITVATPEARMVCYAPADPETAERMAYLRAHPQAPVADHTH